MKRVYGLTGGIASGKSTVGRAFQDQGAIVIDADAISRQVVAPGSEGLRAIIDAFGPEFLDGESLHREALGKRVFGDPEALAKLNAIVHPLVALQSAIQIAGAQDQPGSPIFYEAALLVENDAYRNFAGLVVVACSPATQLARLQARDNISESDARARIASQLPLQDKVERADFVIWNDGTPDELLESANALLAKLRAAP